VARFLLQGMSVCLATDNRLVSRTTATRELQLAIETFQLSPSEVRNLVLEGFKRSFYPGPYIEKQQFLDAVSLTLFVQQCQPFGLYREIETRDCPRSSTTTKPSPSSTASSTSASTSMSTTLQTRNPSQSSFARVHARRC
jgi:hypothetical protein